MNLELYQFSLALIYFFEVSLTIICYHSVDQVKDVVFFLINLLHFILWRATVITIRYKHVAATHDVQKHLCFITSIFK